MTTEQNKMVKHDDGGAMRAMSVPENLDHMYDLVERAFKAGLVPSSFKTVEAAYLATLKGAEFGLLPFQSLAGFYVIGNIAHPYGTCVRGIVQASPLYEGDMDGCIEGMPEMEYMAQEPNEYKEGSIDHALFRELQRALRRRLARLKSKTANGPYFCGYSVVKRHGQEPYCVLFDTSDAHKGQLTNKDMWQKWPTRMYMHRAATFARRDRFSAALIGLEATVEEMQDSITVEAVEVPRSAGPTPTTTGGVLDRLAAAREPITTSASPVTPPPSPIDAPTDRVGSAPPAAGYVPVGEPGASEADDAAVPAAAAAAAAEKPKSNGTPAKLRVKAAHDALRTLIKGDQIDAILLESKQAAAIPEYLRVSNMSEEQRERMAEQLEEHLARIRAARSVESNTGEGSDPDPTDF